MTAKNTRLEAAIMKAVRLAGQTGVATTEITGFAVHMLDSPIKRLMANGSIHRGTLGRRTMRYFERPEWARAYEAKHKAGAKSMSSVRVKAPWPADAPIHYPKDKHGNPLYRVTVAPPLERDPSMPIRTVNYQPW